jgi:hypothetical protein
MFNGKRLIKPLFITILFHGNISYACDLCAIYNSVESQEPKAHAFSLSVAEQFSGFDKVQTDGKYTENLGQQHLESSFTQVVPAFDFTDRFGIQANIPIIDRHFKRIEDGIRTSGSESGMGDISILAKFTPYLYKGMSSNVLLQVYGGLKLPTGDSDRLKEEVEEEGHEAVFKHGDPDEESEIPSAIHGHDLALGSGSFDFPAGLSVLTQIEKFTFNGNIQYVFRNNGDHQYEYADDLTYSAGPAYYIVSSHEFTLRTGANLSGEYKKNDRGKDNEEETDTGIRSLYLGPDIVFTSGDSFSGELAWDLPLDINNNGFQAVTSYRLRAALSYHF